MLNAEGAVSRQRVQQIKIKFNNTCLMISWCITSTNDGFKILISLRQVTWCVAITTALENLVKKKIIIKQRND